MLTKQKDTTASIRRQRNEIVSSEGVSVRDRHRGRRLSVAPRHRAQSVARCMDSVEGKHGLSLRCCSSRYCEKSQHGWCRWFTGQDDTCDKDDIIETMLVIDTYRASQFCFVSSDKRRTCPVYT